MQVYNQLELPMMATLFGVLTNKMGLYQLLRMLTHVMVDKLMELTMGIRQPCGGLTLLAAGVKD